jgi:hypothetical protein
MSNNPPKWNTDAVKINTTDAIPSNTMVPGIADTLRAYEEWEMSSMKDPAKEGPKNLGGSKG